MIKTFLDGSETLVCTSINEACALYMLCVSGIFTKPQLGGAFTLFSRESGVI